MVSSRRSPVIVFNRTFFLERDDGIDEITVSQVCQQALHAAPSIEISKLVCVAAQQKGAAS